MDLAPGLEGNKPFALGSSPPSGTVAAGTGGESHAWTLEAGTSQGLGSWQ